MKHGRRIFLYGAPGVGKTFLSKLLRKQIHYHCIEGDYLREVVAKKEFTKRKKPFVHTGVKEAYRIFGELDKKNVIKGLKAVRRNMSPYILKEINQNDYLIMEASFIDPKITKKYGEIFLIVIKDLSLHKNNFFKGRIENNSTRGSFRASRIIQQFLIKEAKRLDIPLLSNDLNRTPSLIQKISGK